jgi:hypothetical protein
MSVAHHREQAGRARLRQQLLGRGVAHQAVHVVAENDGQAVVVGERAALGAAVAGQPGERRVGAAVGAEGRGGGYGAEGGSGFKGVPPAVVGPVGPNSAA